MSWNWKAFALSIVLFVTGALTGAFIQYNGFSNGYDNATEAMKPIISQAIDKETIKNTISNAIDLKIDKIKKSDTLQINVNQEPYNKQEPNNTITSTSDCIPKGYTLVKTENLTRRQKKRLKID